VHTHSERVAGAGSARAGDMQMNDGGVRRHLLSSDALGEFSCVVFYYLTLGARLEIFNFNFSVCWCEIDWGIVFYKIHRSSNRNGTFH